MKPKFITAWLICLISLFQWSMPAFADESQLISMVSELQKEMKEMRQTIELQNQKITQLENNGTKPVYIPQPGSEAAQAPQMSDYDFNTKLDAATGGAQKWLKGMKQGGDLRLRYEGFHNAGQSANSNADRNRFRFRLRYGVDKTFNEQMKVGFGLASGERVTNNGHNSDPTSTNQNMGNDFNFKNIWIEKAYGTYTPNWAKIGPLESVEFTGGKFNNPFERGASDMVWDRDLKPEGIYETANFKLLDSSDFKLGGYFTAGQFVLNSSDATHGDANLFGYQLGLNPTFYVDGLERPIDVLSAVSFYDYSGYNNFTTWRVDQNATGQSLANGNSTCSATNLCTNFQVLEYYNEVNLTPYGLPVRPFADVAHNLASGSSNQSMLDKNAWGFGLKVGKQVKKGDWELTYMYKWIGADSVVGAFNDSDFGYRGYAGNKGNVLKLGYKLTDDLTVNLAGWLVNNLNSTSVVSGTQLSSQQQSRFQVDLSWKF